MTDEVKINFTINGEEKEMEVDPSKKLLDFIREDLGLTGTKYGCGSGDCGNCTILVNGKPKTSCIMITPQIDGKEITTIEGITEKDETHPIQEAFMEAGAIQCGYCTPAMVLTTKWFIEKNPNPTREEAKKALSGVLCRCTGYKKIVDAVMLASNKINEGEA